MTRTTGAKLFACPKCGQIHRQTMYGSINLRVSPDLPNRFATEMICAQCGTHLSIEELIYLRKEFYEPEYIKLNEDTRTFWQKVKDYFAGRKFEVMESPAVEQPDWMTYPDITWRKVN